MSNCNHDCEHCASNCGERNSAPEKFFMNGNIKNIIGIVSGKGGVGKSLVTGLLASEINKKGLTLILPGLQSQRCSGLGIMFCLTATRFSLLSAKTERKSSQ